MHIPSTDESTNGPINKPTNQRTNQPTNRPIEQRRERERDESPTSRCSRSGAQRSPRLLLESSGHRGPASRRRSPPPYRSLPCRCEHPRKAFFPRLSNKHGNRKTSEQQMITTTSVTHADNRDDCYAAVVLSYVRLLTCGTYFLLVSAPTILETALS